jgi:peptidoglycan/LPS O-acetylase OafA/YrhL
VTTNANASTNHWHLRQLDSIRFWAFVVVFISHTCPITPTSYMKFRVNEWVATSLLPAIVMSGMWGVDMFFVLSAYLITKLLLKEVQKFGALDVRKFYIRRALRIWPLYFLFLGLCVSAGPHLTGVRPGIVELFALSTMSANWPPVFGLFYGITTGVLWSISVEEQFYLFWPLVVKKLKVENLWKVALGMIALSIVSRGILFTLHQPYDSVWCNTFARLDPIAMGILLAVNGDFIKFRLPRWSVWMSLGCMLLIQGYIPADQNKTLAAATLGYLLPALCCVIILRACMDGGERRGPLSTITEYLGRISYGLYLWHGAAIDFWSSRTHSTLKMTALSFVSALTLAVISYHGYEKFFLRLKGRFYPRANINP